VLLPPDRCSHSAVGGPRASALAGKEGGASRWLDPGGRCQAARPVDRGKGAQKATNLAFVVYAAARLVMVLLVMPNHESHVLVSYLNRNRSSRFKVPYLGAFNVHPSAVLLVPSLVGILSALLQLCRCDVVVDVLLGNGSKILCSGARFGLRGAHGH